MRLWLLAAALLIATAHAESTPRWTEVRSPHVLVLTDAGDREGRQIAAQFERMRLLCHTLLPNDAGDAPNPIIVLALKDNKSFTAVEPADYLAKGSLALAGYYLHTSDQNYILLNLDDATDDHPFADVYHEYVHFALRKADWLPLWLNEGLAQYYQNSDISTKDAIVGQPIPGDIAVLRGERLLPLPALLAMDGASPSYRDEDEGSVFYAESWALTHMLMADAADHHTHQLATYIDLLQQHHDPVAAAREAFGNLNHLQERLRNYVQQSDFTTVPVRSALTIDESTFQSLPTTLADANALRAEVLAWDGRPTEARALLDATLRTNPNHPLTHEAMGSLCYALHDAACAKKWFGEAIQLNAASYVALYFYANAALEDNDVGHDAEIESSLRSAIRLAPDFAPPYDCLSRFLLMRRKDMNEAYVLSQRAVALEPDSISYRLNLEAVLLQRQQPDEALAVLDAALHVARTPEDVARVQTAIEQVHHFQQYLRNLQQSQPAPGR
jgi:tetratricopeptide (TPR) repeat protein